MKIKRYIIFLVFLLISSITGYSESDDNKAQAYYFAAENSYENNNYDQALENIRNAEDILGGSNALIQSLKVKILYSQKKYVDAQKELDIFYKHESSEYLKKEMSTYLIKIPAGLKTADEKKLRDNINNSVKLLVNTFEQNDFVAYDSDKIKCHWSDKRITYKENYVECETTAEMVDHCLILVSQSCNTFKSDFRYKCDVSDKKRKEDSMSSEVLVDLKKPKPRTGGKKINKIPESGKKYYAYFPFGGDLFLHKKRNRLKNKIYELEQEARIKCTEYQQ